MSKEAREVFQETLKELGFSNHKPSQMSNSDYWLCTCTAMEKYAEYYHKKKLLEAIPGDDDTDNEAIVFCKEYYPDESDITKETEVFDAGFQYLKNKILKSIEQ